jgi:Mrp family chromosome partitioning ATPase/capsular polysaccharide biosynthesis protein
MGEASGGRPATLAEYQAIFLRRKWMIIGLTLIAASTAYLLTAAQSSLYKASAQVRINTTDIVAAVTGVNTGAAFGDPTRFLATQANVARDRKLGELVVEKAGVPGMTAGKFLGESSATPQTDVDVLDLSVTDPSAETASQMATTYAEQFKKYSVALQTAEINATLAAVEKQLSPLRAAGATGSAKFQELSTQESLLIAVGRGLAGNITASPAEGASKVRPRPKRAAILGGLLGFALGIGLALLAEALDKGVRSEEEIEATLGVPLLGRVPRPTRRLENENKLVMLEEPMGVHAQTFRRLRTSLEFVNSEREARMIMVTSALPREGKSTTVANLAVALARAGRRVLLVDLDLGRPSLQSFFRFGSDRGFTDVVVRRTSLSEAIRSVALPGPGRLLADASNHGNPPTTTGRTNNGRANAQFILNVLLAGTIPPAPDEFLETDRASAVLEDIAGQFDLVLLDTAPLLPVGDVVALSARVDGIVVVTRLGIHRRQLEDLARQLHNCRAPILGFILTGTPHGDSYTYGYGYAPRSYEASWHEADRPAERT